jgi:hypothetical protein
MRGDLEPGGTNLLRRGEDEFMVAALKMEYVSRTIWKEEAELPCSAPVSGASCGHPSNTTAAAMTVNVQS